MNRRPAHYECAALPAELHQRLKACLFYHRLSGIAITFSGSLRKNAGGKCVPASGGDTRAEGGGIAITFSGGFREKQGSCVCPRLRRGHRGRRQGIAITFSEGSGKSRGAGCRKGLSARACPAAKGPGWFTIIRKRNFCTECCPHFPQLCTQAESAAAAGTPGIISEIWKTRK